MSQQVRAAALLREAAAILDVGTTSSNPSTTCSVTTSSATSTNMTQISNATRVLFGPYRNMRPFQRPNRRAGHLEAAVSHWTHKFSVIPRCKEETVPNREEKFRLHSAGLGEKRLTFVKNSSTEDFENTLEEAYPKLRDCGGYELLRTPPDSRISLENLVMPTGGFTSAFLADESNLGQAICYIRPIQKDLDLGILNTEPSETCKKCLTCGDMVPINFLREHVQGCQDTTVPPEKIRRMSVQTPVCQFTCSSNSNRHVDWHVPVDQSNCQETGVCPLCDKTFSIELLETHAACCVGNSSSSVKKYTLEEELANKLSSLNEDPWNINVVRRVFIKTAIEELSGGQPSDFERRLNVKFIGEEGVDGGGLTREFFTLLFEKTGVFEDDGFSYDADLLEKKEYNLIGNATALSIIHGHPGPRRLNKLFLDYIFKGTEPGTDFSDKYIRGADVKLAVEEITSATEENINDVFDKHIHLLSSTGYKKLLSMENKDGAVLALKSHFSFYHYMAPLLKFMEGLKIHGVLALLQKYEGSSSAILGCNNKLPSATEVQNFYVPKYSTTRQEKEVEEMVVYNFSKFLKKVERGTITTPWHSIEGSEEEVTLDMGHVLQSFIGCPVLSPNIASGFIEFDHTSDMFSYVNTCAPSISFCKTNDLMNYENMENQMIRIIVEAEGFGLA